MTKAYPYPIESNAMSSFPGNQSGPNQVISLSQIVRTIRRNLMLLVIVVLSIFSVVAFLTMQMTPIYQSATKVIVDQRENAVLDVGVLSGLPADPGVFETELEIITSPVLLQRVVRKLELQKHAEFNPSLYVPTDMEVFQGNVKGYISSLLPGKEEVVVEEKILTEEEKAELEIVTAAQILASKVKAERDGRKFVFYVTASSTDAGRSAAIANAVADQYLVDQLDTRFEETRRTNQWLDDQLTDLRSELNAAERAVESYRSSQGLLSASGQTLTEQQISDIQAQMIAQEAEYSERRARLAAVRNSLNTGAGAEAMAEALQSNVINNLRTQQAQITRERADLETKYGPRHPDVISIVGEERDLRAQIDAEVRRIVSSLESEVSISRRRLDSLRESLGNLRGELTQNNQANIKLRELERNAEASRTLYEQILSQFMETNQQETIEDVDARVLAYADVPISPALPRKAVNFALGLFLGLAAAGGIVIVMELLDNRVSSGEEIEERNGVPFLGNVPLLPSGIGSKVKPGKYLIEHPMSAYAESMRNLRASVKFANIDNPAKLVTVTSSFPAEGKTSLSLSLSRMSAMTGSRTLVIDGDFRRHQLTETSGLKPKVGLVEYLLGEVELKDVIQKDTETELDILPLTSSRKTTRDVFGSKTFDAMIERLKADYDLIIVDTAPLLLMAESRVIAAKSDQVLVAARWRRTSRAALAQTLGVLREFSANIAGVALTFVDLKRLSKHSGAALSNYKAYSKYYINN